MILEATLYRTDGTWRVNLGCDQFGHAKSRLLTSRLANSRDFSCADSPGSGHNHRFFASHRIDRYDLLLNC